MHNSSNRIGIFLTHTALPGGYLRLTVDSCSFSSPGTQSLSLGCWREKWAWRGMYTFFKPCPRNGFSFFLNSIGENSHLAMPGWKGVYERRPPTRELVRSYQGLWMVGKPTVSAAFFLIVLQTVKFCGLCFPSLLACIESVGDKKFPEVMSKDMWAMNSPSTSEHCPLFLPRLWSSLCFFF